jgi:hypothetical protein
LLIVESEMAKKYEEYEIRDLHGRHKDGFEETGKPFPPQQPQDKSMQHGKRYDNDTREGWLRGSGAGGGEDYPHFDHSKPRSQMRR